MANLLLSSVDIGVASNNYPLTSTINKSYGYITGGGTQIYYYINLKTLLGSDYDKYDNFKIELLQFSQSWRSSTTNILAGNIAIDTTGQYRHIGFSLSGLEFINNPYNPNNIIGNYLLNNGSGITETRYFIDNVLVFRKNDENVTFGVRLIHLNQNRFYNDAEIPTVGYTFPSSAFFFKITGIN